MTHVIGMICQCSTKLPVMPHTDCLAFLVLRCPQKCWVRWRSDDCGGRSLTARTPWAFSSLKVVLSKLWGDWAHCPAAIWIPPQIHKDQIRRWRMSLENGVVLLSLARVEAMLCRSPSPEEEIHPQTWILQLSCFTVVLKLCGIILAHIHSGLLSQILYLWQSCLYISGGTKFGVLIFWWCGHFGSAWSSFGYNSSPFL